MGGRRILALLAATVVVTAGLLVPTTERADANTSKGRVKDKKGSFKAYAGFNPGMHGYHMETSNAGANSFDVVDLCGDGLEVRLTYQIEGRGVVEWKPPGGDCDFLWLRTYGVQTGRQYDDLRPISWFVGVYEKGADWPKYGTSFKDDQMGSYSYDKDAEFFYHTSVYREPWKDKKKTVVATMAPTETNTMVPRPESYLRMWAEFERRTPVPDSLDKGQIESMQKQLYCHAALDWTGKAGPTWDLEAEAPNIPWDDVMGDVDKHRCNWGTVNEEGYSGYAPSFRVDGPPADLAPKVDAGPDVRGSEGSAVKLDGYAGDDKGSPSVSWSYRPRKGVDNGTTCTFADKGKANTKFTCNDDGEFEVTLTADDGVNRPVSDSAVVRLKNEPPKLTLKSPRDWDVHRVESKVGVDATFTDPGGNDTHTCEVGWDDGRTSTYAAKDHSCGTSHTFENAGMYSLDIAVTDDDGGSDNAESMVVVYDPRAGLFTGTGTVDELTFSTTGKYVSADSTKPAGAVVLNLPKGRSIVSTDLDWLVITPSGRAAIKGRGVSHGFLGYAMSGRFRGVVWPLSEGAVPPDDRSKLTYDTSPRASWDVDESKPKRVSTGVSVIDTGWIPGLPKVPILRTTQVDLGRILDSIPGLGLELS